MIEYTSGDLLKADAEAFVNTVNTVGVMGKGIALQFKKAYPDNFREYKTACKKNEIVTGKMFIHYRDSLINPRYIINFPTKKHWREKSRMRYIKEGLIDLAESIKKLKISSIAIPPLGCGLGGLDWNAVKKLIDESLSNLEDVRVIIFEPKGAPKAGNMIINTRKPRMTKSRALFIKLIQNYSSMGYELSKLEFQKMAYFLQEAGEPLKLNFIKYHYGPYDNRLEHVLNDFEGHYIRGYGDGTGKPYEAEIHLLPKAVEEAEKIIDQNHEIKERLNKVSGIMKGYETPYGLELLASVHFIVTRNPDVANDSESVLSELTKWNIRKKKLFTKFHVEKALGHLKETGMVH